MCWIEVKMPDGTWKKKHIVLWEQANGPMPENHVLLFGDNDKSNIELENLFLVPRATQAYLCKMGFSWDNAEALKTVLLIAEHRALICKKLRDMGSGHNYQQIEDQLMSLGGTDKPRRARKEKKEIIGKSPAGRGGKVGQKVSREYEPGYQKVKKPKKVFKPYRPVPRLHYLRSLEQMKPKF
jgi:hypothetical protein